MTAMDIMICIFVFIFGSVIGSFLNVVIYRTPLKQSIINEPSHCFSCGKRLKWYDMFPIFSWIILRGKCRFCGSLISPRYMIMEMLCGLSYLGAYLVYNFSWEFVVACILFAVLLVLSGIDIDYFEIPYWCSIVVGILGIASFFIPWGEAFDSLWYERLISFCIVAVIFFVLVLIGCVGGGDFQLMLGASLLLGYHIFSALFISIVIGAIYGIIKKIQDKKEEQKITEQIYEIALKWYQKQYDIGIGYVTEDNDDVIIGNITNGKPNIEWEYINEEVWRGIPNKSALSHTICEKITNEREGIFRIFIKAGQIKKVKYSRRMAFGPFLAIGIAIAYLFGDLLVNWYVGVIFSTICSF